MGRSDSHRGLNDPSRVLQLVLFTPPPWVSRVASPSLQTCRRHYPGEPVAADGSRLLTALARRRRRPSLSVREVGVRLILFRGLLGVHLLFRPICLLSRRLRPFDVGSFSRFVASSTVPTATGWNDQLPGRDLHPLKHDTFARRTDSPRMGNQTGEIKHGQPPNNLPLGGYSPHVGNDTVWHPDTWMARLTRNTQRGNTQRGHPACSLRGPCTCQLWARRAWHCAPGR